MFNPTAQSSKAQGNDTGEEANFPSLLPHRLFTHASQPVEDTPETGQCNRKVDGNGVKDEEGSFFEGRYGHLILS
jgi:hypothetical protein